MQPFRCSVCDQLLFFENSACLQCGSTLGFDPDSLQLLAFEPGHETPRVCANKRAAHCNWLIADHDPQALCQSCRLTTVRPNDADKDGRAAFADAESAKRRLLYQLHSLKLPVISRVDDPDHGLAFELLSARDGDVITGHESGVITLDLSESDDAHRAFVRQQLGEPYRTVLGHFRHEIGHYYWPMLVVEGELLDDFRALFGHETVSYEVAKQKHYSSGVAFDPSGGFVSQYATMHPWEDWAETFAHYLHIRDGLETAGAYGLTAGPVAQTAAEDAFVTGQELSVAPLIVRWLALTFALNGMSRSIGQGELYPFVLSHGVVQKLDFVHRAVLAADRGGATN